MMAGRTFPRELLRSCLRRRSIDCAFGAARDRDDFALGIALELWIFAPPRRLGYRVRITWGNDGIGDTIGQDSNSW